MRGITAETWISPEAYKDLAMNFVDTVGGGSMLVNSCHYLQFYRPSKQAEIRASQTADALFIFYRCGISKTLAAKTKWNVH